MRSHLRTCDGYIVDIRATESPKVMSPRFNRINDILTLERRPMLRGFHLQ